MKNTQIRNIALMAAMLATAAIASAQVPDTTKPGEATTMQNGQPNPPDKSPRTSDTTRAQVKSEAKMADHSRKGIPEGEASSGTGRDMAHKPTAKHDGTRMEKKSEGKAASRMPPGGAEKAQ